MQSGGFTPSTQRSMQNMSLQHRMSLITAKARHSWRGANIGLMTAGDDSQGMNAAIRAVVRMGMYLGCSIYYIKHGFKGMVDGHFEEASWFSSSDIISDGGTCLKSYKCPEFLGRAARLKAAKNLVDRDICNLVAIGGDGTLKGVHTLHQEWTLLLRDLMDQGLASKDTIFRCRHLKVVCLIASIFNDVVGTDASIGCDSALMRIIEATDAIATTASSSQLAFVVEVMGTHCGFLALASGIACDASMVFVPEWPPEEDWKEELVFKVQDDLRIGCEGILVMLSEGATDRQGRRISAQDVQAVLTQRLELNTKITVLGHVQRGGSPSAYDRLLATRLGAEGVMALRDLPVEVGTCVMGVMGNEITCISLVQCLEKTMHLEKCLEDHNYAEAVRLRGRHFQSLLSAYTFLHNLRSSTTKNLLCTISGVARVGIMRVGKSTLGQCVVTRSVVGYLQTRGYCVLGILDGFEGLVEKRYTPLCWDQVKEYSNKTVACLGSSHATAGKVGLGKVATSIEQLGLSGIVIIGGFPAYQSLYEIHEGKADHPQLNIPMCVTPVTVLNNVPGSDLSVGCDSALNEIVSYCDKMKRVARGRKNFVFIIETLGNNCGYLATVSALCVGSDAAYIRQEPFNLDSILSDVEHLKNKIQYSGVHIAIIIRSDCANDNYDTDFIHKLFSEEGKGVFTCRASKIGQVQMGSVPTPRDRVRATLAGIRCGEWLTHTIDNYTRPDGTVYAADNSAMCVLCFGKRQISFKPIARLLCETDFYLKVPTYMWWMKFRPLMRIMAQHYEKEYEMEADRASSDDPAEEEEEGSATSLVDARVHRRLSEAI